MANITISNDAELCDQESLIPSDEPPSCPAALRAHRWNSSVVSYPERGEGGDARYQGNWGGSFVEGMLGTYYNGGLVVDPMEGSKTTADVCARHGLPYAGMDLSHGFDATQDDILTRVGRPAGLVALHPPYHDMIVYSGIAWGRSDGRDLSRSESYEEYLARLERVLRNAARATRDSGTVALLLGDRRKDGTYLPIAADALRFDVGLVLAGSIIKRQHNVGSENTWYMRHTVRIMHETLLVFRKPTSKQRAKNEKKAAGTALAVAQEPQAVTASTTVQEEQTATIEARALRALAIANDTILRTDEKTQLYAVVMDVKSLGKLMQIHIQNVEALRWAKETHFRSLMALGNSLRACYGRMLADEMAEKSGFQPTIVRQALQLAYRDEEMDVVLRDMRDTGRTLGHQSIEYYLRRNRKINEGTDTKFSQDKLLDIKQMFSGTHHIIHNIAKREKAIRKEGADPREIAEAMKIISRAYHEAKDAAKPLRAAATLGRCYHDLAERMTRCILYDLRDPLLWRAVRRQDSRAQLQEIREALDLGIAIIDAALAKDWDTVEGLTKDTKFEKRIDMRRSGRGKGEGEPAKGGTENASEG